MRATSARHPVIKANNERCLSFKSLIYTFSQCVCVSFCGLDDTHLPFICCSSEDIIYSVDDGELDLFSFEVVVYVLQMKRKEQPSESTVCQSVIV